MSDDNYHYVTDPVGMCVFSLPVSASLTFHFITCIVLGNPARSRLTILSGWDFDPLEIKQLGYSFSSWGQASHMQVSTTDLYEDDHPESGTTIFGYQNDQERYGTGKIIIVNYTWNDIEINCVENKSLMKESGLGTVTFRNEVCRSPSD